MNPGFLKHQQYASSLPHAEGVDFFLANIHTDVEGLQRMTSSHATKFSELEKNRTYVSVPGRFSIVMLMLAVRCERVFF